MCQEVSRGHSTLSNERMNKSEVSQTKEGLNVKWFIIENGLAVKRNSHLKREQVIKSKRMISFAAAFGGEQVLHPYNLQKALNQVLINKGSAGVDRMKTTELAEHFSKKRLQLIDSIKIGEYQVQPILGLEIPKENGKTRLLGVPTVTDRLFQQAVSQILMQQYEPTFSENSYGFRPRKNARQAIGKALEYIHEGNQHIVDIDLKTFFDEVDHCLLLNLLHQNVKCPLTLKLIRNWLRAPIQINGKLQKRRIAKHSRIPIKSINL
jgi:retron-type reverse transcriptase